MFEPFAQDSTKASADVALTTRDSYDIPADLRRLFRTNGPPVFRISPCGRTAAVLEWRPTCPLHKLAEPSVAICDVTLNPITRAPHAGWISPFTPDRFAHLTLVALASGRACRVSLPAHDGFMPAGFSPDGGLFALATIQLRGITLWVVDVADGAARALIHHVNAAHVTLGHLVANWSAAGDRLIAAVAQDVERPRRLVEQPTAFDGRGRPRRVKRPQGFWLPSRDQRNLGRYFRAQLVSVDVRTGDARTVGPPGLIEHFAPSPDDRHVLVSLLIPPVPVLSPLADCPRRVEVWTTSLGTESGPIDCGIRPALSASAYRWHPGRPDTLVWIERHAAGDPVSTRHGDAVIAWQPRKTPRPIVVTDRSIVSCRWTQHGTAIVTETPDDAGMIGVLVVDRAGAIQAARIPTHHALLTGEPLTVQGDPAALVVEVGGAIYVRTRHVVTGSCVQKVDLATLCEQSTSVGRANVRALPIAIAMRPPAVDLVVASESPTLTPRLQLLRLGEPRARTVHVSRGLRSPLDRVRRLRLAYQRRDGLPLAANAYLPPDYDFDAPLPTALVVFPTNVIDDRRVDAQPEFENQFLNPAGVSGLFLQLVLAGYALVWDTLTANRLTGTLDTYVSNYVSQMVDNVTAAIDSAVNAGFADRARLGVIGNCRGAAAAAHLLAHTRLFRAGITLNGFYNPTRRPFASADPNPFPKDEAELHRAESVFEHAADVSAPVMVVQGEADADARVVHSKMFFTALRANGVTARYVSLPFEGHAYRAHETMCSVALLMRDWFDHHVKHGSAAASRPLPCAPVPEPSIPT